MGTISSNKVGILAIAVLGLVLIGSGVYFFGGKTSKQEEQNILSRQIEYQDPRTTASIKYPEEAHAQPISEEDKKNNIALRLTEREGQTPFLVTLRSESGLRAVATLTRASIIDVVMGNSEKALPQRFKGFHKESGRRYEHNGRNAGEFIFTYDSPVPNERIKQRFVILVKDDDTAVYLAMQAKEADFDEQNQKIFNPMAESLNFQ
jgi:hypothetical protein